MHTRALGPQLPNMAGMQGGEEWQQLLGGDASPGKRWRLVYTVGAKLRPL